MEESQQKRWVSPVAACVFLALTALVATLFLRAFPAVPLPPRVNASLSVPVTEIESATSPAAVLEQFDRVIALGDRCPGMPGYDAAHRFVRDAYRDAGLDLIEQPVTFPSPVTETRAIFDEQGKPLDGVEIFPLLPNHLQPVVTPEGGLTGRIELVTDELLAEATRFDDAIALVDARKPPKNLGLSWSRYAQVGFRAVIVADRGGLAEIKPASFSGMVGSVPINFVRLAATEKIFDYVGKQVKIDTVVRWKQIQTTNLVGVLRSGAGNGSQEAIVIHAEFDAPSFMPDRSPGSLGALNLAVHLNLVKALAGYRKDLQRDVIFVAHGTRFMGMIGLDRLLAAAGPAHLIATAHDEISAARVANQTSLANVQAARKICDDANFLSDAASTSNLMKGAAPAVQEVVESQLRFVINDLVMELGETVLARRLDDIRARGSEGEAAALSAFQVAKREQDQASAASSYPPEKIVGERAALAKRTNLAGRLRDRLQLLETDLVAKVAQGEADLKINEIFGRYSNRIALGTILAPADPTKLKREVVAFNSGALGATNYADLLRTTDGLLASVAREANLGATFRYEAIDTKLTQKGDSIGSAKPAALLFNTMGWPAFDLVNPDRSDSYSGLTASYLPREAREMISIEQSLKFTGRTALSIAMGIGRFEPIRQTPRSDFGGRVLAGGIGKSIIPSHPLVKALVASKAALASEGFFYGPVLAVDPEGWFELPFNSARPVSQWSPVVEAARLNDRGMITWIRDEGPAGASTAGTVDLTKGALANLRLVGFRAAPVCVLDLVNPQTLRSYTNVGFGLAPRPRMNGWLEGGSIAAAFVEPDSRCFLIFYAGTEGNPLVQEIRAFALAVPEGSDEDPESEMDRWGFLAADTPFVRDVEKEVARSMLLMNKKRGELQARHGMLDRTSVRFQNRSEELLAKSATPGLSQRASSLLKQDAVTYAQLNHPVLRESIREAVIGILWYLGLLVPFVFFFEKLALGFTDIRKQLFAHAVIFVLVFALLRWLHPAFEMVRSSVMILLGFVIMLISLGVTALFSGKFGENLDEIRRQRGQVVAAQAHKSGVIATAFLLGLNNMHRRKVRTGLTCATLVLMTFAMICFAGIQSRTTSVSAALGKAMYQGLLIHPEKFKPIDGGELFALRSRYGREFQIAPRFMLVGVRTWQQTLHNPSLLLTNNSAGSAPGRVEIDSILTFMPEEPLRDQIKLLTNTGWFTPEMADRTDTDPPVMLPEKIATELGVTIEQVNSAGAAGVSVQINGKQVSVVGIFDPQTLAQLRDIDGRDLLPFNIEAARAVEVQTVSLVADDTPRLPAERIILSCRAFLPPKTYPIAAQPRLTSVAIGMPGLPYRQVKEQVEKYLEQTGQPASYGIDGVAYFGRRTRASSLVAFLEMLAPLLIAGITVLNTMNGSVYERRDEIFVYNAVGIAPKYIGFMFFAEAIVYAVVASVLGYLLSQGIGKLLTTLDLTGGLNMTFTSITTIWASIAVMVCVFVSTWFPARSAMRIAQTTDDSGWKLPPSQGDAMDFELPFTFDWHDRVAVLSFFHRFFLDHGPGSSGRFLTGFDQWSVTAPEGGADVNSIIPKLATTAWLKPFDLGVSQRIEITLPLDPATGEYIARIRLTRLSGTHDSWVRLNEGFVATIRQQFLHWRAVSPAEKTMFFSEARESLEKAAYPMEKPASAATV